MHVDNKLVEFMTAGEQEYEEIIKEYKEILVKEGALEPSVADFAHTPPAQGKPRCITLILNNHWIYIYVCVLCIYVTRFILKLHA